MTEVVFNPLPFDEIIVVRIDGQYAGRLIRTNGEGPLWANDDLREIGGFPFSSDSLPTNKALSEWEQLYNERSA